MKFRFYNKTPPPINTVILVCNDDENAVGLVESIQNETIKLLLLDRVGSYVINQNDNWMQLNIDNLETLRHVYKLYINKNINNIIVSSYSIFKNKHGVE